MRCSATFQKNRVFSAQGLHTKWYRHNRMDWHTKSIPLPKDLNPNVCKNDIQNLNRTVSLGMNQQLHIGFSTFFVRLSSQIQIERKEGPFSVTKLITVHMGVFT